MENTPRGIRNCNPLNIRRTAGALWKGRRLEQTDKNFVQFQSMEWGLRAAFCILRTYAKKYRCTSIRDIIRRWAPPCENDTARYVHNVCRWTGLGGKQQLTPSEWPKLVQAMARQECGTVLLDEIVNKGFQLYKNKV